MSNPSSHPQSIHNLPLALPSTVPSSAPAPSSTPLSNMHSESHIPPEKYDAPRTAPPSALAAVATAHPLVPPGAPSSSTLHPASSSSRPSSLAMPQTMLSNMPISYSYQLPSLNPLSQPTLTTTAVPPMSHQPSPPNNDLHNLACLAQPLANPLTHSLHPSQIPHSEPAPTTHPALQHHPIQHHPIQHHPIQHHPTQHHPIQHHHDPMAVAPNPSSLNAAAAAAAAVAVAGVATPADRDMASHAGHRNDANLMYRSSAMHVHSAMHPPSAMPPSAMPPSGTHHPLANPYHSGAGQSQRQASPANSEAAEAPSTDGIGAGSTGGGASTVGAASVDGAGGVSGSSSGNGTEDRGARHGSTAPSPADVAGASAPPSSGRRRPASEMDSPRNARANKRPHRSISHAEKRRLCEISNAHPSAKHGHIASVFQSETGRRIERSTVTRVLQRKDFWMSAGTRDSNRKRLTSPRFPTIEEALFELIRNRTRVPALRAMLTDKELMKYSKDIAELMRNDNGSMDKNSPNFAPHLRSFRGSLSWVTSFKKRNALMPPEESKTFPVRPFVSSSFPGEALDIWQTELDIAEATEMLQECTRLEDMYFLDAVALAASARPEHAAVSSRVTPLNYESAAGIDEAFGIVAPQNQGRGGHGHEANGHGIPQIDFSMPILSSNTQGMSNPIPTNDNSNVQNSMAPHPHTTDNFAGMSSAANQPQQTQSPTEPRHPVHEDTIVYGLFCSNGVGNDKRPPWIVGRRAFAETGSGGGEVWPGCPVRYFHNKQGWITGRLTRTWMEEFDRSVDRKVIVVTSLLNACDMEMLDLKNVTILPVPRTELGREKEAAMSWSSSSPSPMHHGIEQMFRAKYRSLVMERALRQMGEQSPLKNVCLKTVATMVKEAWEKVPIPVIRRAWREISYLPPKFNRSANRPRSNGNKPMWGQTLLDLSRLMVTYRDAISSYTYAEDIELRQSDVFAAGTELSDYMWLSVEESPFHPSATILQYARSACADMPTMDDDKDPAKVMKPVETRVFQLENHEDALHLVNKLADFIKSDPSLGNEQNLYLAGSLQLEVKKECDRRRNEAEARNWIEANGQRSSGLP